MKEAERNTSIKNQEQLQKLFRTAYYVAKNNLSFLKYESICELQQLNGVHLGKNYATNKACTRFVNSIATDIKDSLRENVDKSRFISILSDGSADKGIIEEEGVFVRYVKNGEPLTNLISIEEPYTVDAPGIFDSIVTAIKSLKLSSDRDTTDEEFLSAIYKKCISINFDGASVMSGYKSGVQKRFKDKIPGLVYTHCVAHRTELAILDSIKSDDEYLEKFDDNLNKIFKFYYVSPVRRKELKKIGDMFGSEFRQLGLLKKIRWIASRARALNIIETNYEVLIFDLESKSYGTSETAKKALGYLQFIKEPKFLFYLNFLQDLVNVIKFVSFKFQEDQLLSCEVPRVISDVKQQLDSLLVTTLKSLERLMSNLKPDPINTHEEILMYKSVTLNKPDGRRADKIPHNAEAYESFYRDNAFETIVTGTQKYLENRFEDFDKTPLKQIHVIFDFKQWPKSFSGSNRNWGLDDVKALASYYVDNAFISKEEAALAPRQWLVFRNKVSRFRTDEVITVYIDMMREKDEDISAMLVLLEIMMTLSSSTAACERGFSCMNLQKTNIRTSLLNQTLDDILRISIDGPPVSQFKASEHVISWNSSSKGKRHLEGHAHPQKKFIVSF